MPINTLQNLEASIKWRSELCHLCANQQLDLFLLGVMLCIPLFFFLWSSTFQWGIRSTYYCLVIFGKRYMTNWAWGRKERKLYSKGLEKYFLQLFAFNLFRSIYFDHIVLVWIYLGNNSQWVFLLLVPGMMFETSYLQRHESKTLIGGCTWFPCHFFFPPDKGLFSVSVLAANLGSFSAACWFYMAFFSNKHYKKTSASLHFQRNKYNKKVLL